MDEKYPIAAAFLKHALNYTVVEDSSSIDETLLTKVENAIKNDQVFINELDKIGFGKAKNKFKNKKCSKRDYEMVRKKFWINRKIKITKFASTDLALSLGKINLTVKGYITVARVCRNGCAVSYLYKFDKLNIQGSDVYDFAWDATGTSAITIINNMAFHLQQLGTNCKSGMGKFTTKLNYTVQIRARIKNI